MDECLQESAWNDSWWQTSHSKGNCWQDQNRIKTEHTRGRCERMACLSHLAHSPIIRLHLFDPNLKVAVKARIKRCLPKFFLYGFRNSCTRWQKWWRIHWNAENISNLIDAQLIDAQLRLSRCAALQSHQRQSSVKSHNITLSFSRKLHPNPSVPTYPHNKTKLHTKPWSISSCRRKAAPHSQTIGP